MTITEQLEIFARTLWEPTDRIEIRPLPAGKGRRAWIEARELSSLSDDLAVANRAGADLYAGVLPRDRDGGTEADVTAGRVAWIDFDDTTPARAEYTVNAAKLPPPSLIVNSGHGAWVYWRLSAPVDKKRLSALVADLADFLGGDPSSSDPARIARIPGFTNHKPPVAEASVFSHSDSVVPFERLRTMVPERDRRTLGEVLGQRNVESDDATALPVTSSRNMASGSPYDVCVQPGPPGEAVERARRYVATVEGGGPGGRTKAAFRVAAILLNDMGIDPEAALHILTEWDAKANEPTIAEDYGPAELEKIIRNAAKYAKHEPGEKAVEPDDGFDIEAFYQRCQKLPETFFESLIPWIVKEPKLPTPILDGVIGRGDKLAIIGPSKARKTSFALQLATSLAGGFPFLGINVHAPQNVGIVQLEIGPDYYRHRFHAMAASLARGGQLLPATAQIGVFHGRGRHGVTNGVLLDEILKAKLDVVLIDPIYKIQLGDENSAQDMGALLRMFDAIAHSGCAVTFVHHDKKGGINTDIIDRGAGSGIVARDYDAAFILSPDADNEDLLTVDVVLRNFAPVKPFQALWADGSFLFEGEAQRRGRKAKNANPIEIADAIMDKKYPPMFAGEFRATLKQDFKNVSRDTVRDAWKMLLETGRLSEKSWPSGVNLKKIGRPEEVQKEVENEEKRVLAEIK